VDSSMMACRLKIVGDAILGIVWRREKRMGWSGAASNPTRRPEIASRLLVIAVPSVLLLLFP